jgi:hypothetical protein
LAFLDFISVACVAPATRQAAMPAAAKRDLKDIGILGEIRQGKPNRLPNSRRVPHAAGVE